MRYIHFINWISVVILLLFCFLDKLKSIFNEAGVFQGIIYVLLLKLSANLTKTHGIAPGGEFRRALKEVYLVTKLIPTTSVTHTYLMRNGSFA